MRREQSDGLLMSDSIYMFDEKKQGFPIYSRVIQFATILIGSWGVIGLLLEALAAPVHYLTINLVILLFAGLMYAFCIIASFDLVKLFFVLLFYVLFFLSRIKKLENGFYIFENLILERISNYYEIVTYRYVADYTNAERDITLIMIMIVIPVVTLLSVAVIRNRLVSVAGIILFLPVIINFGFGLIPSERYLIAYLMAVLYMTRSSYHSHKLSNREQKLMLHRINSQAAIWLSIICLSIFLLIKLIVSEESYESISEIKDVKHELQTKVFNYNWQDFTELVSDIKRLPQPKAVGGLNGGYLGTIGEVEYTESEQLRVTALRRSIESGLYLKGYVGSVYTGKRWKEHSDKMKEEYKRLSATFAKEDFNPVNILGQFMENNSGEGYLFPMEEKSEMTIEYENANKNFLYVPYITDYSQLGNIKYVQDLYVEPKKKKNSYTLQFDDRLFSTDTSKITSYYSNMREKAIIVDKSVSERLYEDFVREAYTQLPEKGLERLKEEFSDTEVIRNYIEKATLNPNVRLILGNMNFTSDFVEIFKILYVLDYLSSNTTYSLSPGKLPAGKDFVEYFLFENKKGYCAHYASAATLMLRVMGVPARYVEGYAISSSDINANSIEVHQEASSVENSVSSSRGVSALDNRVIELSVKDSNAHAWVEVYLNGSGWIPVDFTAASALSNFIPGMDTEVATIPAPDRTPSQEEEKTVPTEKPTPIPTKPASKTAAQGTSQKSDLEVRAEKKKLDSLFLWVFIILVIGALSLIFFYYKLKNKNNIEDKNRNWYALVLYMKIEKILKICKQLGESGNRLEDIEEDVKENCPYLDPAAFETCMEIIRKARFGKGNITREEVRQVENLYFNLFDKAYQQQDLLRKAYMKLLFSLNFT